MEEEKKKYQMHLMTEVIGQFRYGMHDMTWHDMSKLQIHTLLTRK